MINKQLLNKITPFGSQERRENSILSGESFNFFFYGAGRVCCASKDYVYHGHSEWQVTWRAVANFRGKRIRWKQCADSSFDRELVNHDCKLDGSQGPLARGTQ